MQRCVALHDTNGGHNIATFKNKSYIVNPQKYTFNPYKKCPVFICIYLGGVLHANLNKADLHTELPN